MIDRPILTRVTDARDVAIGIRLITLEPIDGVALPVVIPGAHIDVALPAGMIRQYSVLDPPGTSARYTIAVARDAEGRGGSIYLHDSIVPGEALAISAPRCLFPLIDDDGDVVLIAGGIGITPLWSMIQRLEQSGRAWNLHYAARSRSHAALIDEIEAAAMRSRGRVQTYFNLDGDPLMDLPTIIGAVTEDTHFYACGPAGLLEAYRRAAAERSAAHVHWEQFVAAAPAARDGGYVIELAKSGKTVTVAPGQSILEALSAAGLRVNYSCREGVCGACETGVIAGIPDHRDAILTEDERAEGRTMMICCSGSCSERLVLDL